MTLTHDPISPSAQDTRRARESSRTLASLVGRRDTLSLRIESPGHKARNVDLPRGAIPLLVGLLDEMSKGHAVALLPVQARLTTQQAAELLGVSRPFIVKELSLNRIPHIKVGTHRRILLKDLLIYRRTYQKAQDRAMNELVEQAQELGMGYQ
jgi:excisionase family DNA binding protein